jgi:hypothetical protein
LTRLLELDVEVMIEGHGHIHTYGATSPRTVRWLFERIRGHSFWKSSASVNGYAIKWMRGSPRACRFRRSKRRVSPGGSASLGRIS